MKKKKNSLKRIHVNRQNIAINKKNKNNNLPPLSTKTYSENVKSWGLKIDGPSKIVYRPDKPLSCGAVLWIETRGNIVPLSLEDAKLGIDV